MTVALDPTFGPVYVGVPALFSLRPKKGEEGTGPEYGIDSIRWSIRPAATLTQQLDGSVQCIATIAGSYQLTASVTSAAGVTKELRTSFSAIDRDFNLVVTRTG